MGTRSSNISMVSELGTINELPVIQSDIIYEGSAVGLSSGYARPLEAGDPFMGFAERQVDNSAGGNGDITVRVKTIGLVEATIDSVAITNVGDSVYMSDDDTFTLVSDSNSLIGKVYRYVTTNTCVVRFSAF
jgi:hypothetical protein